MVRVKRLADLRKSKGLSQSDFAEKVGVSQQTISKYEIGKLEPDIKTLNFFAEFFDVTIDYLLGRSLPTKEKNNPLNKLKEEMQDLTVEEENKVKEYARFLISQRKPKL